MSLNTPVFDTSDETCDIGQVLNQVLNTVKSLDVKLDEMKVEQQELKKQINIHEGKLNGIIWCVQGFEKKPLVVAEPEVVRNEDASSVSDFCSRGDWAALQRRLLASLDQHLEAHKQIRSASSFHSVGSSGHMQLVILLLDSGLPVNHASQEGFTLLHGAAEAGHVGLVQVLLSRRASTEVRTLLGWTPLMFASLNNRPEVVELLVCHGADVNAMSQNGLTSLLCAARVGHLSVVEKLLKARADTAAKFKGKSLLDMANASGNPAVVRILTDLS